MILYVFFWLFFSGCALIEINNIKGFSYEMPNKNILVCITFILLFIFLGFRWETATDWQSYSKFFEEQKIVDFFSEYSDFEIGYVYFTRTTLLITNSYTAFLCIHASLFLALLFLCFKHFCKDYLITAIFFYFAIHIGVTGSNRQLLALVIGLYGVVQLTLGRKFVFFFFVYLAFQFHTTAVLFILYFFINKRLPTWIWLSVISLTIIIGYSDLPPKIFAMATILGKTASGKVDFYADGEYIEGSIFGVLKRLVIAAIFILFEKRLSKRIPYYHICLNAFLLSVCMFFLFKKIPVMGRANLYFNITEPIMMVFLFSLFKERIMRTALLAAYCVMSIFYFRQSIQLYPDLFLPYKGIWINENYRRTGLD